MSGNIPIITLEKINNDVPFIIIEIINFQGSLQFKIRYANKDLDIVKLRYNEFKKIIKNSLLIVNCYISDITENNNHIHKIIGDFHNQLLKFTY